MNGRISDETRRPLEKRFVMSQFVSGFDKAWKF